MRKYQRLALWVAAPLAFASGCANGPGLFTSSRHGQTGDASQRMVQAADGFDQESEAASAAKARPLKPSDLSRQHAVARSKPKGVPETKGTPAVVKTPAQQTDAVEAKAPAIASTATAPAPGTAIEPSGKPVEFPSNWEELRKELLLDESVRSASTAEKSELPEVTPAKDGSDSPEASAVAEAKSELPEWSLTEQPRKAAAATSASKTAPAAAPKVPPAAPAEAEWTVEVVPAGTSKSTEAAVAVTEEHSAPKSIAEKPQAASPFDADVFPEDANKAFASKGNWAKEKSSPSESEEAIDKAATPKTALWARLEDEAQSEDAPLEVPVLADAAFADTALADDSFEDAPFAPPMEKESPVDLGSPFAMAAAPVETEVGQSDAPNVWSQVIAQSAEPSTPAADAGENLPAWAATAESDSRVRTASATSDVTWTRTSIERLCPELAPELYPIVDQLGDENTATRLAALAELAERGEAAATADLAVRILLDDADPVVRAHAAATLRVIKHDAWDSVKTLRLLVFHPNPEVAKLVCYLLRGVGPEAMDAAPELRTLRDSKRGLVSLHAAEALLEITPHDAESVACLITASTSQDPAERAFAVSALGVAVGPHQDLAVSALTKSLKDDSLNVRAVAALSLGGLGAAAAPAREALEQVAANDVPEVREAARVALDCLAN